MKRALLKTTRRKFKLHENEKDLNEIILSRKRENHTETWPGECGDFSDLTINCKNKTYRQLTNTPKCRAKHLGVCRSLKIYSLKLIQKIL